MLGPVTGDKAWSLLLKVRNNAIKRPSDPKHIMNTGCWRIIRADEMQAIYLAYLDGSSTRRTVLYNIMHAKLTVDAMTASSLLSG